MPFYFANIEYNNIIDYNHVWLYPTCFFDSASFFISLDVSLIKFEQGYVFSGLRSSEQRSKNINIIKSIIIIFFIKKI